MASVTRDKTGSGYRISYWLRLPAGPVRRQRRAPTQERANKMRRSLERVEDAIATGLAAADDLDEWIARGWVRSEEAEAAIRGYRQAPARVRAKVDFKAIEEAYEAYALKASKAQDASRKTHLNNMSMARQVLRWLEEFWPTLELGKDDIQDWLDAQDDAPWTLHHRLTKLRLLLDQAERLGMVKSNPAREVSLAGAPKRQRARRILSPTEAQKLLDASLAARSRISGCLPTIIRLGLYAGLRNEEMAWLTWEAIDLERGAIEVRATVSPSGERWSPKTGEFRELDIKAAFVDYLQQERVRQEEAGILGPFVLVAGSKHKKHYRGRPLTETPMKRAFDELTKSLGIDGVTIYSMRHTYATTLLRAGLDVRTVQARMGHADIRTTMQYLRAINVDEHPTDVLPY